MDTLALFRDAGYTRRVAADELIFQEGQPGDVMYVVLTGHVEIMLHGRVIHEAGPGALVGEMALIDDQPRSASALAKTECTLAPVDQARFAALIRETPEFALHVMRVLARRLRAMDDHA